MIKSIGHEGFTFSVVFFFLAIIGLWPLPLHFLSYLPGGSEDLFQYFWNHWWVQYALFDATEQLFFTRHMFYPTGSTLAFHALSLLSSFLSVIIAPCIEIWSDANSALIGSYNFILVVGFWSSGYFTYLLARRLSLPVFHSFLAGIYMLFCPLLYAHMAVGHMSLVWNGLLSLCLERIVTFWEKPTWPVAVSIAFVYFLNCMADVQYFVFAGLISLLFVLVNVPQIIRRCARGRFILQSLLIVLLTVLFVFPLLLPKLEIIYGGDSSFIQSQTIFPARIIDYLRPSFLHPLWGNYHHPQYPGLFGTHVSKGFENNIFLGYTALVLAFAGFFSRIKHKWFWILSMIVFFILSLGSNLGSMKNYLYFWVIESNTWLQSFRTPVRFSYLVYIPLSLFMATGLWHIQKRFEERWGKPVSTFIVAGGVFLICFEFLAIPVPLTGPCTIPSCLSALDKDRVEVLFEPEVGVFDFPRYLYYQTGHSKPYVNGYLSRARNESKTTSERLNRVLAKAIKTKRPKLAERFVSLLDQAGVTLVTIPEKSAPELRAFFLTLYEKPECICQTDSGIFELYRHRDP